MHRHLNPSQADNLETEITEAPLQVMFVDDDEDDFIITRDLLAEIQGNLFNLEWAETFDAGLAAMRQNRHDVYLIDYRLGEKNGLELLSEAIKQGCSAPIILLTGQGDRTVDVEAMKRGAADYLVKGDLDAPTLERAVRYAIERKNIEEATQQLAEQRKRLLEVSQTIFSTLTLNEIISRIQQAFAGIISYDANAIYWLDKETGLLRPAAKITTKFSTLFQHDIPPKKGICSEVLRSKKGVLINYAHHDPRSYYPEGFKAAYEHLIGVPILTATEILGVYLVARFSDPPFTHEEFELVQLFLAQASSTIENARLHAETEKRAQQLAVLHELDRAIATSLRLTDIYHAFTQHAVRLLPYDRTSIILLEENKLRVTYVAGENNPLRQIGDELSQKHSIPAQAIIKGQPLIHNIAREDNTTAGEALWGQGIESSLIIPLRVKGHIIGTWNLGSHKKGIYSPDDLAIAQSIADQLAIAIENARLFSQARQEITERKRIEEALRQSEEKYRTLIERMSEGLLQIDPDNHIQFVNDSFCEMVGYTRHELLGKSAAELVIQNIPENAPATTEQDDTQLQKKNGDLIWVQVGHAPLINTTGTMVGSIKIYTDITERKRAEETRTKLEDQLRQSQKMEAVGTLAGGIAHDFNNLLTAIMGYSGLALDNIPPEHPIHSDLLGIQRTAERAAGLTRQLLAFARRQTIELRVLDLNELILNMGRMLPRLLGEDIELVTLPAPDLGLVKVDPGQLEQVIMNLAVNARDAMPEGGKLTLETANATLDWNYVKNHAEVFPGEYVMLAVTDTGLGIPQDIQNHIFEPFFTTKEVDRGTGLGLATCFGIIKQSDGHIWVYSEPRQGTTFKVYLPRMPETEIRPSFKPKAGELPTGAETVLLVEDEASLRELSSRMLQMQGYSVLQAANGDEALQIAHQYGIDKIDLVVTDVVMPQMGGVALADKLKILCPPIKILFTSGYTDRAMVNQQVMESGANFLQKPFSLDALARKVRAVLDRAAGS